MDLLCVIHVPDGVEELYGIAFQVVIYGFKKFVMGALESAKVFTCSIW